MPTATDQHHPPPRPSSSAAGPDINIPPPNSNVQPPPGSLAQPTQPSLNAVTPPASNQVAASGLPQFGMSPTQIVIAVVLVLVWAGLLIVVKRLLTQSLVSQFADLGRSRGAGTTLYLFLLVLGATVTFCALGSFWQVLEIMIPAAVLNVFLLILFLFSLASARSSRQRR